VPIGASSLGVDPRDPKDDRIGAFSSPGARFSAPGVAMPVAHDFDGRLTDINGTSFAAPYAAGVAALMLKANPNLRPDDIETIWKRTARDLPGEGRDGFEVIDEVAAIRAARDP
jgi:subtilisin family serine protease